VRPWPDSTRRGVFASTCLEGCSLPGARNVILLGDPLQLAQVSQGTHPAGSGVSVLERLFDCHPTVPPDMGIFLDRTRRMHPDVCRFVSEIVYEGRLDGLPEVARQATSYHLGQPAGRVSLSGVQLTG
jgi:uncharacterized protein